MTFTCSPRASAWIHAVGVTNVRVSLLPTPLFPHGATLDLPLVVCLGGS
jgi:hypothetical protein